jgi:hypothetical protein
VEDYILESQDYGKDGISIPTPKIKLETTRLDYEPHGPTETGHEIVK